MNKVIDIKSRPGAVFLKLKKTSCILNYKLIRIIYTSITNKTVLYNSITNVLYFTVFFLFRRDPIQAIGCDGNTFCVYVLNSSVRGPEIYEYLSKYLKNAKQVEICEFKTVTIEEFANLQSGDKIVRDPVSDRPRYGSLGFLLKSKEDYYAATCRHVTVGCDAHDLLVELLDGSNITVTEKYEPSLELDFAVIKLHETPLPVKTGVRNMDKEFVRGRVFMSDEFTMNPETPLYKWGSNTSLTFGLYKETYEKIEHTEDSYPWIIIADDVVRNSKKNVKFAEAGDSGSLVCFTGQDSEVALCLVIGAYSDPGTFACCRIADGLSLIKKEIPDINHLLDN